MKPPPIESGCLVSRYYHPETLYRVAGITSDVTSTGFRFLWRLEPLTGPDDALPLAETHELRRVCRNCRRPLEPWHLPKTRKCLFGASRFE